MWLIFLIFIKKVIFFYFQRHLFFKIFFKIFDQWICENKKIFSIISNRPWSWVEPTWGYGFHPNRFGWIKNYSIYMINIILYIINFEFLRLFLCLFFNILNILMKILIQSLIISIFFCLLSYLVGFHWIVVVVVFCHISWDTCHNRQAFLRHLWKKVTVFWLLRITRKLRD